MNVRDVADNGGYNPAEHVRGQVLPENKDKDKAGRGSKSPVHGCRLTIAGGDISMRYGLLNGHPWMNVAKTVIEIPVQGMIKFKGKWHPNEDYLITVKGRNLETVFDQLNEDKRISLHKSGGTVDGEAHVDSIEVEQMVFEK